MADEQAVIKRMEQYAKAAARKVLLKFGLGQDQDRHEDITHTLFLAGWEVWRNTGDWEKARHRMVDRAKNEAKALRKDLKVEQFDERQLDPAIEDWDEVVGEGDAPLPPLTPHHSAPKGVRVVVRSSVEEDLMVQEYLDTLTERQRRIVQLMMIPMVTPGSKKGMTEQQIADELGVPLRTVQREKERIRQHRKEYDRGNE